MNWKKQFLAWKICWSVVLSVELEYMQMEIIIGRLIDGVEISKQVVDVFTCLNYCLV